ncbi:MAG: MBL fold metallo-hydrolase [Desulfovibrio sp.]|nr:MBL fold metallo-hydrolase [Desulfovibrio sp.]
MRKNASILALTGILLLASLQSVLASDAIWTYKAGDITVMRLVDQPGGVPAKALVGADKTLLENTLHGGICPAMFLTFLLKTPTDCILVDTGNGAAHKGQTLALLKQLGLEPGAVTKILLTHMHGDHVGGLFSGEEKTFPQAKVYVEQSEYRFWTDRKNTLSAPTSMASCFDNAERFARLYEGHIHLFRAGERLFPWLISIPMPGHTQGHTGFLLTQGGKSILLAGDFLHCLAVQTANPDVAVIWDSDQNLAKQTRRSILERFANSDTLILGGHFPNPGAVHFTQTQGKFAYTFVAPEKD